MPMLWRRTKPSPTIIFGARSDVGQVRTENQDSYGRFPEGNNGETKEQLFIVADGMGGHAHGQEASRLAVNVVQETFFSHTDWSIEERLRSAFEMANTKVYERAQSGPDQETMGTTCTALAVLNGNIHIAHVGDSRAYLIDREGIQQITYDHTLVEELRRQGVLTEDEAKSHPRRHALTRALGIQPTLEVDVLDARPIEAPQSYLLCSDGLAPVTDEEIHEVVIAQPPQSACERLVAMANERGGPDNVTVLLVTIG